jgi:hypothetical protein
MFLMKDFDMGKNDEDFPQKEKPGENNSNRMVAKIDDKQTRKEKALWLLKKTRSKIAEAVTNMKTTEKTLDQLMVENERNEDTQQKRISFEFIKETQTKITESLRNMKLSDNKLIQLMEKYHGNKFELSKNLGIKYSTIFSRSKKLEMENRLKLTAPETLLLEWDASPNKNGKTGFNLEDTSTMVFSSTSGIFVTRDLMHILFPEITDQSTGVNFFRDLKTRLKLRWLDGGHLMDRWGMDAFEIISLIIESGFPAYDSYNLSPVRTDLTENCLSREEFIGIIKQPFETQKESLKRLRFPLIVVERFEEAYGELLEKTKKDIEGFTLSSGANEIINVKGCSHADEKTQPCFEVDQDEIEGIETLQDNPLQAAEKSAKRHSAICKEKCREIAKTLWDENPTLTIREMTEQDDVIENSKKINGQLFNEDTIRSWINDLCPNRSPGRPPKQNS